MVSTQASSLPVPVFGDIRFHFSLHPFSTFGFSSSLLKSDSGILFLTHLSFIQPATEGICLVPDCVLDPGSITVNNPDARL